MDATLPDVIVPQDKVVDGVITLNINTAAAEDFFITMDVISFKTRFDGVSHDIFIPINAVRAIFSRDSGQGMVFNQNPTNNPPNAPTPPTPPQGSIKKEHKTPKRKLRIY